MLTAPVDDRHANADHSRPVPRPPGLGGLARLARVEKSAWPIAAFTVSGWKGFVIRKVGSGRSPVSSRSGKAVMKITGTS